MFMILTEKELLKIVSYYLINNLDVCEENIKEIKFKIALNKKTVSNVKSKDDWTSGNLTFEAVENSVECFIETKDNRIEGFGPYR